MENYKFVFNDKTYELGIDEGNCLINDEEYPVVGIECSDILELLNQQEEVNFDIEHYEQPCQNCHAGVGTEEKIRYFKFLEYHFYIFTKESKYIISSISKEYQNTSFNRLLKRGKVDNSYYVSVMVCVNCGDYSIEIEQCDV